MTWLRITFLALTLWMCLGHGTPSVFAAPGPPSKVRIEGVVVAREGQQITVRSFRGEETRVFLSSDTQFLEDRKNFLRDPLVYSDLDVVRGLKVKVKGSLQGEGRMAASRVSFTQRDLDIARMVESNLIQVDGQLTELSEVGTFVAGQIDELGEESKRNRNVANSALSKADQALLETRMQMRRIEGVEGRISLVDSRLALLDDYETAETTVVHFGPGAAVLDGTALQVLDDLAGLYRGRSEVFFEVAGFASSDGEESFNRRLSQQRASEVVHYLMFEHRLPARSFVIPHGYGELMPMADNSTPEGRQMNRRAEVRVLVNKGVAAINSPGSRSNSSP